MELAKDIFEFIQTVFKATPTKLEGGEKLPASSFLVVEDPAKPSTWHLPVKDANGKPDRRRMGAAKAALTVGFRGNVYEGAGKAEALAKLKKLYEAEEMTWKDYDPGFFVSKDDSGAYRWVLISSNAYRDRDGEIVSQKALQADVARADADGDYGPLRWWHVPGLDIGDTDFNMLNGKFLVESGTFRSPEIAEAVKAEADELQASIGFRHPATEPDQENVYNQVRRFERSLVPRGRASNPFTSLTVKEGENEMTSLTDKIQAFKALLKDDELASHILQQVETKERDLDAAGVAFKEESAPPEKKDPVDANPGGADTTRKADESGNPDTEPEKPMSAAAQLGTDYTEILEACKGMMTECKAMLEEVKGMYAKSKDDATARQQEQATAFKAYQDKLALLEKQQTATIDALSKSQKEIRELMGDLPKGIAREYLASQAEDTVVQKDDERVKQDGPRGDALSNFMKDFAFAGTPFGNGQTNPSGL